VKFHLTTLEFAQHWVIPEQIHTAWTDGFLEVLSPGGSKAMEIQARGGSEPEKVFFQKM